MILSGIEIAMNETTPILEAIDALPLTDDERVTLAIQPAVRTLGDLLVVIARGEVEPALAKKIKKAIKP